MHFFSSFFFVNSLQNFVCLEQGKFLALDLGGTNFRVILLELENGKVINEVVKMYHIGSEIRVGDENVAVALFDYIGQCLCDFVEEYDLVSVPLPLGKPKELFRMIFIYLLGACFFFVCVCVLI